MKFRVLAVLAGCFLLVGAGSHIIGTPGNDTLWGTIENDRIEGFAGSDTLYGNNGDDVLVGGPGPDTLNPGPGNDFILLSPGDSSDVVIGFDRNPHKVDTIRFTRGVHPSDVRVRRMTTHVLMIEYGHGDRIRIPRHFENNGRSPYSIERIEFARNRTFWSGDRIRREVLKGTKEPDYIVGYEAPDKLYGYEGDDIIFGGPGNDQLFGGAGNDFLNGEDGRDILVGGAGDDRLRGENGSDTYIYAQGHGLDTIYNFSMPGDSDVIKFVQHTQEQVLIEVRGPDLWLLVEGRQKESGIKVANFRAHNAYPIAKVEFADGKFIDWQGILSFLSGEGRSGGVLNAGNQLVRRGQQQSIRQSTATTPAQGGFKVRTRLEEMQRESEQKRQERGGN